MGRNVLVEGANVDGRGGRERDVRGVALEGLDVGVCGRRRRGRERAARGAARDERVAGGNGRAHAGGGTRRRAGGLTVWWQAGVAGGAHAHHVVWRVAVCVASGSEWKHHVGYECRSGAWSRGRARALGVMVHFGQWRGSVCTVCG